MMWTRKELKTQAKEALQRNYWRIVLVSFLSLILCGGFVSGSGGAPRRSDVSSGTAVKMAIQEDASANIETEDAEERPSVIVPEKARMVGITIFILIALALVVFAYILSLLLVLPFQVGVSRFMIKSIEDTAKVRETAYAFDHSYKNVVKTMFHYDIRVFLWYLLFIIPGIYKQYQYRMVPYILAEHPDMHYREVLQKSSELMNGQKWKAFVLDLSFVLWHILGIITCGIVQIFYVTPYWYLTNAALYRKLSSAETLPPAPAGEPLPDAARMGSGFAASVNNL